MSKKYISGPELYQAWCDYNSNYDIKGIAENYGVSPSQLYGFIIEIKNRLTGGRSHRKKNKTALEYCLTQIKEEANAIPFPTPKPPEAPAQLEVNPLATVELHVLLSEPVMHANVMYKYIDMAKRQNAKSLVFMLDDVKQTTLTIHI